VNNIINHNKGRNNYNATAILSAIMVAAWSLFWGFVSQLCGIKYNWIDMIRGIRTGPNNNGHPYGRHSFLCLLAACKYEAQKSEMKAPYVCIVGEDVKSHPIAHVLWQAYWWLLAKCWNSFIKKGMPNVFIALRVQKMNGQKNCLAEIYHN